MREPSSTTDAAVSSQLDSMARIRGNFSVYSGQECVFPISIFFCPLS